jgi:LmbE family N-acetylglucosaminyl deacetylase/glycosyltransferase involved in cell wall biosynthesis
MGIPEAEAIPFEPLDLRGERLLVLAPHPDDEVIGCGGLVALHLREGRKVQVVVATDGGAAGDARQRETESRAALASLGDAEIEFLHFPDRGLAESGGFAAALRDILVRFAPDLIAVPSAIEIHPDHLALSRTFCDVISRDAALFADLAVARVAFYEVSHPLRPNALVDITALAESKYAAIAMHASQLAVRDYVAYARGLNAYRAMSLPPEVKFAEAYYVVPLPELRTTPFSGLRAAMAAPPNAEVVSEPLPISVVIRTKDRPVLLQDAIASVRATGYPAEIVVVNDGGAKPEMGSGGLQPADRRPEGRRSTEDIKIVNHDSSRGRAEAANSGVRAASGAYIAFLDDDDLYYPEHLATLANAARVTAKTPYTDAVSAFVSAGETRSRMRIFSSDFDRDLLLIDNYIPLPTLLIRRDAFLDLGGFDPAFELFEDWDFLIRLAQRGDFLHVPRITCEIRHVEGAGSITLENPEGTERFRAAKLQVWNKHRALLDDHVFANAFERLKRRAFALAGDAVEARGAHSRAEQTAARAEREVTRVEQEKAALIAEVQAQHERHNAAMMRIATLEGANGELHGALEEAQKARDALQFRVGELGDARAGYEESQRTINALWGEITRLQGLLDAIYRSRTWKLHEIVERMKGRG